MARTLCSGGLAGGGPLLGALVAIAAAEVIYRRLRDSRPRDPLPVAKLAELYLRTGKLKEGREQLETLHRENPANPIPLYYIGLLAAEHAAQRQAHVIANARGRRGLRAADRHVRDECLLTLPPQRGDVRGREERERDVPRGARVRCEARGGGGGRGEREGRPHHAQELGPQGRAPRSGIGKVAP